MGTLYSLTARERDILSNLDRSDVIATGPWCKGEATLPHRVVIRDLGHEYVVHTQIIGESKAYYEHGIYIRATKGFNALDVAWAAFNERVRRHHDIPIFKRCQP